MAGFSPVCPRQKLGLSRRGSINIENRYNYSPHNNPLLVFVVIRDIYLSTRLHPTLISYYHAHYEDERVAR